MPELAGRPIQGRIGWWRFAVVTGAATMIAGGMMAGMANGAIAASFAVAGSTFKVSADTLDGTGFAQYGGFASEQGARKLPDGRPDPTDSKNHPVVVNAIADATLFNLCQSVTVVGLPASLIIRAGQDKDQPARATGLLIDAERIQGKTTFTNVQIGRDASTLSKGGTGLAGQAGQFGQQADRIVIEGLKQRAWSTTAGSFTLTGLDLQISVNPGGKPEECF